MAIAYLKGYVEIKQNLGIIQWKQRLKEVKHNTKQTTLQTNPFKIFLRTKQVFGKKADF